MNAGCRHSRGSPSWPFLRAFLFVWYLLYPLPVRRVVRGPAPRYNERRTFCFRFFSCGPAPRHSERRTLFLCFLFFISLAFYHVALFHPGKLIFTAFFCSAEMFTTFLHEGRELFVHLRFLFPHLFLEKRRFWSALPGG